MQQMWSMILMTIQSLNRNQLAYMYNMSCYYEKKSVIIVYICFLIRYLGINTYIIVIYLSFKYKISLLKYDMVKKIK